MCLISRKQEMTMGKSWRVILLRACWKSVCMCPRREREKRKRMWDTRAGGRKEEGEKRRRGGREEEGERRSERKEEGEREKRRERRGREEE